MKSINIHNCWALWVMAFLMVVPQLSFAQRNQGRTNSKNDIQPNVRRHLTNQINRKNAREKQHLAENLWILYLAQSNEEPIIPAGNRPAAPPAPGRKCKDCGKLKAFPANPCKEYQDKYKELSEEWALLDQIKETIEELQEMQENIEFYGGLADYLSTAVTVGTAIASGGVGGVVSAGVSKKLKSLALGKVKGAAMDQLISLIPPPYDKMVEGDLSGATLTAVLDAVDKKMDDVQKQKSDMVKKINDCIKKQNATIKKIQAENQAVTNCRNANAAYCGD